MELERDAHFYKAAYTLIENLAASLEEFLDTQQRRNFDSDLYRNFRYPGVDLFDWIAGVIQKKNTEAGRDAAAPELFQAYAERFLAFTRLKYFASEAVFDPEIILQGNNNVLLITTVKDEIILPALSRTLLVVARTPLLKPEQTEPTPLQTEPTPPKNKYNFKLLDGGKAPPNPDVT